MIQELIDQLTIARTTTQSLFSDTSLPSDTIGKLVNVYQNIDFQITTLTNLVPAA